MPTGEVSEGFFVLDDCDRLSGPITKGAIVLQKKSVNGRTAGVVYRYTGAGVWAPLAFGGILGVSFFDYQVENLAAGADIGDGTAANARSIWVAPAALVLSKLSIISQAAPAGIADANTCVIKCYRGADTIVTKTYNTATVFPAATTQGDLGTLANTAFAAGDVLRFDIVNGAAADPPAFILHGEFNYS